jgi:hypothetical protein
MLSNTLFVKVPDQEVNHLLAPDHNHEKSRARFIRLIKDKIKESTDCAMISVSLTKDDRFNVNLGKDPAPDETTQMIINICQTVLVQGDWQAYDGNGLTGTH